MGVETERAGAVFAPALAGRWGRSLGGRRLVRVRREDVALAGGGRPPDDLESDRSERLDGESVSVADAFGRAADVDAELARRRPRIVVGARAGRARGPGRDDEDVAVAERPRRRQWELDGSAEPAVEPVRVLVAGDEADAGRERGRL